MFTLNERVKYSVKNQKNIRLLLKLFGKWLTYSLIVKQHAKQPPT